MDMLIKVIDNLPVETTAMIQALYSRSPKSVIEHLKDIDSKDPGAFMSKFYVGYGHKSIGDCGSTSIFIEGVSMLAAKAIQDWPLYSGQEASTRYMDMSVNMDPVGEPIQAVWRGWYERVLETMIGHYKGLYPLADGQSQTEHTKAVRARAFDVARGFLPAGCTTFVSWHTNLRQAADHLRELICHPLSEVRTVASNILLTLREQYPSSFKERDDYDYIRRSMETFAYEYNNLSDDFYYTDRLDHPGLSQHMDLLTNRPPRSELHQRFRRYGTIEFNFPLDFGSYRDLQRQRSCVQTMPLLTLDNFEPWYLSQLPDDLRRCTEAMLEVQADAIEQIESPLERQYYIPMGYQVPVSISCTLPSAVYIAELRSSDSVHPTLRIQAQRMGDAILECVPGIKMHHDTSSGTWNIKRGQHDIVKL